MGRGVKEMPTLQQKKHTRLITQTVIRVTSVTFRHMDEEQIGRLRFQHRGQNVTLCTSSFSAGDVITDGFKGPLKRRASVCDQTSWADDFHQFIWTPCYDFNLIPFYISVITTRKPPSAAEALNRMRTVTFNNLFRRRRRHLIWIANVSQTIVSADEQQHIVCFLCNYVQSAQTQSAPLHFIHAERWFDELGLETNTQTRAQDNEGLISEWRQVCRLRRGSGGRTQGCVNRSNQSGENLQSQSQFRPQKMIFTWSPDHKNCSWVLFTLRPAGDSVKTLFSCESTRS